ncbi:UDP-N-acetylglucosamine--N-acetylmuramyl-(pentapeptide) pyrophosphoryl-undecaprenol N-acetylglucosamine transferase [Candidatus Syntrophocurvum alkaliphilum]|uniref:UDP-N-acetylglucosamine--N-acetylmuramyl-(pentapeptide) pyrophosphoryl-undecaprenol N-acetylglucosamine transferase n=1 Tax=Candidatus Syntrophocurvum alkaliphilum TaxID=2293317 RepID=A0A6I6D7R0_9FIRM|nr:undecaprenyldiphospho-muramoylpentapeptide beta-N-acetylglucosaminyltransferase [Candidatus Syntrophocurvum alkaliphilum]QGT99136.1 UDP-N-acetylglucosamine--N-acetylmuramyl-(pentapeptide) pyrophosphoryl-undecaprenol N-acetylglucosamine transferase [Candidatus Syntrophocurvum alkaliphilum]
MRLIITGGGTGGHIYPAIAIANEIKERIPTAEILFVGTEQGLENKIIPEAGYDLKTINITGIDRTSLMKAGKSLLKVPVSFWQAKKIINKFKPEIVIGTGGYVSYPVVLAGTFFANKTVIHEQNAIPGLANRNLASRVDYTLLTFEEAASYLKAKQLIVTGLPVRKEILKADIHKARKKLDLANKFTLLAFGGSRGAMSINQSMLYINEKYKNENMQILWITGEENYDTVINNLKQTMDTKNTISKIDIRPYMHNIEDAFAASDLVVCRAGASTLSELAVIGLPAILVPYPYAAENHQEKNARALVEKNAAEMVIDEFLDGDTLYKKIEEIRNNKNKLEQMKKNILTEAKPNALKEIVDIILK